MTSTTLMPETSADHNGAPLSPEHLLLINRLATIVGVEPTYTDVMGQEHFASPRAKQAVLTALGICTVTVQDAARAIEDWRQRFYTRLVAPVTVLRRGQDFIIPVVHHASLALQSHAVQWTLTLEHGESLTGETHLAPWDRAVSHQDAALWTALNAPLPGAEDGGLHNEVMRWSFDLPSDLPDGYHTLSLALDAETPLQVQTRLIVAPAKCWVPADLENGKRLWGVGAQIYSLRSGRNWGMGDLGDLKTLCTMTGKAGADLVGINPIHALFMPKPEDASPYSPNSRLFLNPLYISVEDVPEYATCPNAKGRMADSDLAQDMHEAKSQNHVAYRLVSRLKLAILPILFDAFRSLPATHPRQKAFAAFVAESGERLRQFAIFQAIQDTQGMSPWMHWPQELQDPNSDAVIAFAQDNEDAVTYHQWLQFECDRQLGDAAQALREHGGRLGLYRDLAVGASPDGADTWMDAKAYVLGARFGAPPDALGPMGQDWGLPPFAPHALEDLEYEPFIAMVRANMRHAGALRMDHAMALMHLFWIPPGLTAKDGVYITYPLDALVAILALESHRAECMIIGEDLGTVPKEFQSRMAEENVLSYRLLYFERYENGLFMRPEVYPKLALATPTSHDLATIVGHWRGWDVAMRHRLGIAGPDGNEQADMTARAHDRELLRAALVDQGLIRDDFPLGQELDQSTMGELIAGCHRFLARSPSMLMLANLDDLCAESTQVNVPGTVNEYPNWRRFLPITLEEMAHSTLFNDNLAAMADERR